MRSLTFGELFAMLSTVSLSTADLARLREWLAGIAHLTECIALIEQAAQGRPCPHCHCPRLHGCGHASGLRRFRCLGCRRSYNALTGTPLARLRKKKYRLTYLQCMLESRTVRQAAAVTGVHRTTSFRWRHRFVPSAARDRPRRLTAIVEVDDRINANTAFFLETRETSCVPLPPKGARSPPAKVKHHWSVRREHRKSRSSRSASLIVD